MITLLIYNKADGLIVSVIIGSTLAVGVQDIPETQDIAYGTYGRTGQYYDATTGLVSDTPPAGNASAA